MLESREGVGLSSVWVVSGLLVWWILKGLSSKASNLPAFSNLNQLKLVRNISGSAAPQNTQSGRVCEQYKSLSGTLRDPSCDFSERQREKSANKASGQEEEEGSMAPFPEKVQVGGSPQYKLKRKLGKMALYPELHYK